MCFYVGSSEGLDLNIGVGGGVTTNLTPLSNGNFIYGVDINAGIGAGGGGTGGVSNTHINKDTKPSNE